MKEFKRLLDIKEVIKATGLTECESQDCDDCEFGKRSPEYNEFGGANICMMLNEIYRTK
jgi:hypothetical protein